MPFLNKLTASIEPKFLNLPMLPSKYKMKTFYGIAAGVLLIAASSCKKDKKTEPEPIPPPVESTIPVKLEFENMVDNTKLEFGKKYINPMGDTFQVSVFNYFISNIVLVRQDNSVYTESNSYHLFKHSAPSTSVITLQGVPSGNYKAIRFMLGVDSTASASGAKTGDLDQSISGSMYWTWSSGYIFMKLEGSSPKSGDPGKYLSYHIGGYGGVNKTQRSFELNLQNNGVNFAASTTPAIRLTADVNQLFKSPVNINFAAQHTILQAGTNAKLIADNYADMLSFKEVRY